MQFIGLINFLITLSSAFTWMVVVRLHGQNQHDKDNHAYILTFPAELKPEQIIHWLGSISGTLKAKYRGLAGVPTIALELWAEPVGYTYRLRVPWQYEHHITDALTTMIPGMTATPDTEEREDDWRVSVEIGESDPDRHLRILSIEQMTSSILASMKRLDEGESVVVQLVIAGHRVQDYEPPPPIPRRGLLRFVHVEHHDDAKKKLAQTNFSAVLRVGATAESHKQATNLINKVRGALTSANGSGNQFTVVKNGVGERINQASSRVFRWPARFSADELAALMAWPVGNPNVPGLPQAKTRSLAPSPNVPRDGLVLGDANAPGYSRPVAISRLGSTMHTYISASTGGGKTVALGNIFAQVVAQGSGAMIVETKGEDNDLFHKALNYIPASRLDDVLILDVADTENPVGFNLLEQGNPQVIAANMELLFEQIYGAFGVRMPAALYHGLMVFMTSVNVTQPLTIADLPILYAPRSKAEVDFADHLIRGVPDDEIQRWWQLIENQYPSLDKRNNFFEPVNQRLWQINGRPELRNIFGQSRSSFDMKQAVQGKKIILVNLPGLGRPVQNLLGAMLIDRLWGGVKAGAASPADPFYLFVDEFQNYPTLATDASEMLAEARAHGLAMVLASQSVNRLTPKVAHGLMDNARNKIVMSTSHQNADLFAREMSTVGTKVTEQDFVSLGPYEAICRLVGDRGLSEPVTVNLSPPLKPEGLGHKATAASRANYGRRRTDVEREIKERRNIQTTTKRKPTIGKVVDDGPSSP